MAKTNTKKFTVQEKLNKMDVDVIEVAATYSSNADNEVCIQPTEIPNAVAVPGGTALLQSIFIHNPTAYDSGPIIIISNTIDATDLPANSATVAANLGTTNDTIMTGIQGIVDMGPDAALGSADMYNSSSGIGHICKAVAGSTSLYFWAFNDIGHTDTISASGTYLIKFGFVKD